MTKASMWSTRIFAEESKDTEQEEFPDDPAEIKQIRKTKT